MDLKEYVEVQGEEMKKHRWIESEKCGHDLGDSAYLDWIKKYAKNFREWWEKNKNESRN